ncbi:MAG: response regulator [Phycisphaerales bacterium]|jgi:CheY-like chemotaxis protein|nr:response regulator [Phycisphaerales bacterium]
MPKPTPSNPSGSAATRTQRLTTGGGRPNTVGLHAEQLDKLFDQMDSHGGGSHPRRGFVRWDFRYEAIPLKIVQPDGTETWIKVACRNISRGGMSVLHAAFLHLGTEVLTVIPKRGAGAVQVEGEVVRCQHRMGSIHEIGIKFKEQLRTEDFLLIDPFDYRFSLESVDPDTLEGTLVYVEDSKLDQKIVRHFLRDTRLRIREAASTEDGLRLAREGADVLLCDYNLQDGNAADIIERLRSEGIRTPVIVVTSDASLMTRQRLTAAEANAFLTKPLTQDTLLRALGEFLLTPNKVEMKASEPGKARVPAGGPPARDVTEDLREILEQLQTAMKEEDAMATRSICLGLRGSAPAVGLPNLAALADEAATNLAQTMSVEESIKPLKAIEVEILRALGASGSAAAGDAK